MGVSLGGFVPKGSAVPVVHYAVRSHHQLLKDLFGHLKTVGALPEDFPFSVCQVLKDAEIREHKDHNKEESLSLVISTGDFTGGELVIEGEQVSSFRRPVVFSTCSA